MNKKIGLEVKPPKNECSDEKCPWHGKLTVRGTTFKGTVVSNKAEKTSVIKWTYYHYVPKYERYMRRNTRVLAHKPDCILVEEGDEVKIAECRPISKNKKFVIIEKIKR